MKKLMVSLGYHAEYVIEPEDAVRLLEIASRAIRVTRQGYSGPYFEAEEQEPFIERAELVEFEPLEAEKSSADSGPHLRAARDLP
jgi:hypothetical protein